MNRVDSINLIKQNLLRVGYPLDNLEVNYDFMARQERYTSDIIAFSSSYRKDLLTSCIAVKYCTTDAELNNYKTLLAHTAALIAILPTSKLIVIQPLSIERDLQPLEKKYDEFENYIEDNRISFSPETLQAAKKEGRQLSLFELDPSLYEYVSEISKKELVNRFEDAIRTSFQHLRQTGDIYDDSLNLLTKIAIKLLTAKILVDKKIFDSTSVSSDALSLLRKAAQRFPGYFQWGDATIVGEEVSNRILDCLGKDYTYKAITNEQLGYFYEHTFVTEKLRKELGIYYTPQKIARTMLKSLPIEEIHPKNRYVLDGTCGSGSLLTAAYNRLYELLPQVWDEEKKHDYLIKHIRAIDRDVFATEIAKKSLLLASLPLGDNWNIDTEDFLKVDFRKLLFKPYIIVANPPFKETREDILSQKATQFLYKYVSILPDGGLISIVLPESYLQNRSCIDSRDLLLKSLEILEMWQLPEGAFPMAHFATMIISGRKKKYETGRPVRIKRLLQKKNIFESTFDNISFRFSYITTDRENWISNVNKEISFSVFQDIWRRLGDLPRLGQLYEVRNGIIVGKAGQDDLHTAKIAGSYKFLSGAKFIQPYSVLWGLQTTKGYVTYPGKLHRPRLELKEVFESKNRKILINSGRSSTNPWRLYAAVDREGYFPYHGLHCLFANTNNAPELEVLVAVLNSYLANAFIDSFARKRWITEENVKSIPTPSFTQNQKEAIISIVKNIERDKSRLIGASNMFQPYDNDNKNIQEQINRLDKLIFEAYGLSEKEQESIKALFEGFPRPGFEWRKYDKVRKISKEKVSRRETWKVTGKILDIKSRKQTMLIWMLGYNTIDKPIEISIPQTLPGWALKGDISFEATIPIEQRNEKDIRNIEFLEFSPMKNAYLTDNEIEKFMIEKLKGSHED